MEVTDFENKRWSGWKQPVEFRHTAALSLIDGDSVLDIGCGDGLFLSMLAEKGIEGEGVDISEEAVLRCREKGLSAQRWVPTQALPYETGSFDCVALLDVLEHVYDPEELFREARRVSRSSIIVSVPNFSSLPARLQTLMGKVPENNAPNKGHVYWFNYPVLRFLSRTQAVRIDVLRMNTFSVFKLFGSLFPRLLPNLFALSYVIRFKK